MCDEVKLVEKIQRYPFIPIVRNSFPAPIPYIVQEDYLPKNQKILVVLPHVDDGRYFGMMLYYLNRNRGNSIRIVNVCSGHHGVDENISKEKKIEKRLGESLCWGATLGFDAEQFIHFQAEATYESQKLDAKDKQRMRWLISWEKPTVIFVPHISDTAQAINYHTRDMVLQGLTKWMTKEHQEAKKEKRNIFLFEYPTNHVPFIAPSDRNFIVDFDPGMAEIKHQANKAHESQSNSGYEFTEKMVEAIDAVTGADTLNQIHKYRKYARLLSGVDVDPMRSRGEHFGVTKLRLKDDAEVPYILEEQVKFPLSVTDKKKWFGTNGSELKTLTSI